MDSFELSSDSEEGLLDEIVVGGNYRHHPHLRQQQQEQHWQHLQRMQFYQQHKQHMSTSCIQQKSHYEPIESPIHYCDTAAQSDDNSCEAQENQPYNNYSQQKPTIYCSTSSGLNMPLGVGDDAGDDSVGGHLSGSSTSVGSTTTVPTAALAASKATTIVTHEVSGVPELLAGQWGEQELAHECITNNDCLRSTTTGAQHTTGVSSAACNMQASTSAAAAAGASFNNQLTADMCSFKNSKSRRLEYSLKCLKYGRSNPSQDSAFGSLTDNDLSIGSSSFRLSSFQSISSPIDEGVEDVIIATTTGGKETCLELATIPRNMVSQDSAISSPCRELSPSNFLTIDVDAMSGMSGSCSGGSSSSGSTGNLRPQQFPVSLSPKILVTATTNSSNSSLASSSNSQHQQQQQQQQQFDPPKILVNDQNSIYTTSPSKRCGPIEVFSQKYRVSSFEDMSPNKRSSSAGSDKHLKNVNRMAFRSLEEERRIDSAFMPMADRTNSENRVNMQSEKYKKLTHASFRISKTSSQITVCDISPGQLINSTPGSTTMMANGAIEMQRPATATGSTSSRQTLWRDSKFYRKNHIAKSNDSLLETSPNHSARRSPSSLRDNHYDSGSSSYGGSRTHSRQSLNRGCSINEITGSNQTLGMGLAVTTSFCGNNGRRYCSSKSEDLGESCDYLRVMDARKSYSERHLVTLTKLKQTAINNTMNDDNEQFCLSEDEMSFNEENKPYGGYAEKRQQQHQQHKQQQRQQRNNQQQHSKQQYTQAQHYQSKRPHPNHLSWSSCSINHLKTTNIKTTSLATLSCLQTLSNPAAATIPMRPSSTACDGKFMMSGHGAFNTLEQTFYAMDKSNEENSSSTDDSSSHQLSGAELSKIFAKDEAQGSSCSEEKTPLLDSVEMSPISPTEPEIDKGDQM